MNPDSLTCPTCWAFDLDDTELCDDRNPICLTCCASGEHHWTPVDRSDTA